MGVVFSKDIKPDDKQGSMTEEELNDEYERMLDALGAPDEVKKAELAKPYNTKFQIYQLQKKKEVSQMVKYQIFTFLIFFRWANKKTHHKIWLKNMNRRTALMCCEKFKCSYVQRLFVG